MISFLTRCGSTKLRSFRRTPGSGTESGSGGGGANKWRQIVLVQSIVRNLAHESLDKISPHTPRSIKTENNQKRKISFIHKNSNSSNQNLDRDTDSSFMINYESSMTHLESRRKRNSAHDDCARFLNSIRTSQNSGNRGLIPISS